MTISRPIFLVLLLLLPLFGYLGFRRKRVIPSPTVVSTVLRAISLILLILALCGPTVGKTSKAVHVVYAIDRSDSITEAQLEYASAFVAEAMDSAPQDHTVSLVVFASDSDVVRSPGEGWPHKSSSVRLTPGATDIAAAVYRSLEILPPDGLRRIVLLSDGAATRGDTRAAADAAAAAGVAVDIVPLEEIAPPAEVLIRSIDAPQRVAAGAAHEVRVVVSSTVDAGAEILLFRDDELQSRRRAELTKGDNVAIFETAIDEEGWYRYQAYVTSTVDRLPQNNSAARYLQVRGRPVVLYVSQPGQASEPFLHAATIQGLIVRTVAPEGIPDDLVRLLQYDAVILDNVPAYDLSVRRMELLERYVEGAGGGLLMIGGDSAYGAGGYYRTPIERLLPVDMDITSSMRIPTLAMVFVIDKSGSMGNTEVGGASKLDLVKEAVLSSVEIMNPFYNVGLLAFDADFEWTVPLTPAGETERIRELLSSLASGGGTILDSALLEALSVLSGTRASVKHLVVLSDGLTSEAEFEPIVRRLAEADITVSTVSIGANANRTLMESIARWGDGRHYHTASTRNIPRIFTSETTIVSRNLIVEETFFPRFSAPSPVLAGIEEGSIPPLFGFVLTYPKAGANQPLSGTGDNPILATWRYGLGRTAAFTSDLRGRWGRAWVEWPEFPRFVSQLIRWIERPVGQGDAVGAVDVSFDAQESTVTAIMEARRVGGGYLSARRLLARVLGPDGEVRDYQVEHTDPGRYRVAFEAIEEGDYLLTLRDADANEEGPLIGAVTSVFTRPYPREYAGTQVNYSLLTEIVGRTGGRIHGSDPGEVYRPGTPSGANLSPLWPALTLAALAVFLIELVLVYVLIPAGALTRPAAIRGAFSPRGENHSYDEVRAQIQEGYRREQDRRKDLRTWYRVPKGTTSSDRRVSTQKPTGRKERRG